MAHRPPRGCLGFLFALLGLRRPEAPVMPKVLLSNRFVTNAEADFFRVLRAVVGGRGHVLAQVSLGRLLYFPGSNATNPGRGHWWNKVAQRSVDFVVCHPSTLAPLLAIELDEPSHETPSRRRRDEEVNALLREAGLPVLRIPTARNYNTRQLAEDVLRHL